MKLWFILGSGAALLLLGGVTVAESNTGTPLSPFAEAIGYAEGFFTPLTRPRRNNNPGDFILAPPASNYTNKSDGTYAVFDNVQDGWQALEDQLDLIRRGASSHYNLDMSFNQMAAVYSPDGWQNWANNVASKLGASPEEAIRGYL